jgi:hypothetical protein
MVFGRAKLELGVPGKGAVNGMQFSGRTEA